MDTHSSDPLVLILDPATRALLDSCAGPGLEGWRLTVVDQDLDACPLAWALPGG